MLLLNVVALCIILIYLRSLFYKTTGLIKEVMMQ